MFTRTNSNPELIQERKQSLERYLFYLINSRFLRGYSEIKALIAMFKRETSHRRKGSFDKDNGESDILNRLRVMSETKILPETPPIDEWI